MSRKRLPVTALAPEEKSLTIEHGAVSKKTMLRAHVKNESVAFIPYSVERYQSLNKKVHEVSQNLYKDVENVNMYVANHSEKYALCSEYSLPCYRTGNNLSEEFINAWFNRDVLKMVYNLIIMLYEKSTSPFEEEYLRNLKYSALNLQRAFEHEENLLDLEYSAKKPYSHQTCSSYTMVEFSDGKRHKMETVPTFSIELTEIGKNLAKMESTIDFQSDIMDIYHESYMTALELLNGGLIWSTSDIWSYQNVIQGTARRYIYRNKTNFVDRNITDYTTFFADNESGDNESQDMTLKLGSTREKNILHMVDVSERNRACFDCINKAVKNSKYRSEIKENLATAWSMVYFDGYPQKYVASMLNVSERTVYRLLDKASELILNDFDLKEELHNIIQDRLMND